VIFVFILFFGSYLAQQMPEGMQRPVMWASLILTLVGSVCFYYRRITELNESRRRKVELTETQLEIAQRQLAQLKAEAVED
jgi:hypothetical protein